MSLGGAMDRRLSVSAAIAIPRPGHSPREFMLAGGHLLE
jgi:hypothetical protein